MALSASVLVRNRAPLYRATTVGRLRIGSSEKTRAARQGLLSHASPPARILIGKGFGEAVSAGQTEAEIVAIGASSVAPS